jgi:hypothetical protein
VSRGRWRLPAALGLAVVLLGLLVFTTTTRGVQPVRLTEMKLRAIVRDASGNEVVVPIARGHAGPVALPVQDVRCAISGSEEVVVVRCEAAGATASTSFRCEPFEVGLFSRTDALTMRAPGGVKHVEIGAVCAYQR